MMTLGKTQPFRLGALFVEPAGCRVVDVDRREERLEPRVMQVLVALWEQAGSVVSRDELIDRCWNGRIVSDDAVNRIIYRLRGLGDGLGGGAFHIETIPKIGYRLVVPAVTTPLTEIAAPSVATAAAAQVTEPSQRQRWHKPAAIATAALALMAAIWAGFAWLQPAAGSVLEIAVPQAIGTMPADRARALQTELVAAVDCDCIAVRAIDGGGSDRQFRLGGELLTEGKTLVYHPSLTLPGATMPIWRGRIAVDATRPDGLAKAAQAATTIALCAVGDTHDTPEPLAGEALRQWAAYCAAEDDSPDRSHVVALLQRTAALAPRSAGVWATLATLLPESLPTSDPDWATKVLVPARQAAAHALALAPESGDALLAAATVRDPRDYAGREQLIEAALKTPGKAYAAQAAGHLYRAVGRLDDARRLTSLSVDLQPWNKFNRQLLVESLRMVGDYGGAEAGLGAIPDADSRTQSALSLEMTRRDWRAARQVANDLPDSPYLQALIPLLEALANDDTAAIRASTSAMAEVARQPQAGSGVARALALGGEPEAALAVMDRRLGLGQPNGIIMTLYEPAFADARRLPAFAEMASRRGLLHYWQISKRLPNFCNESGAPPLCQTLRLGGAR